MNEVTSLLKDKGDCECGLDACDLFGLLGKPDAEGNRHARGCPCKRCQGGRNRRNGLSKQRAARRLAGVPDARVAASQSNEENWRWLFRCEAKSGIQVKALTSRFLAAEKQAEASRAIGDGRPFLFLAMPPGITDGVFALRGTVWRDVVLPALDAYYGDAT